MKFFNFFIFLILILGLRYWQAEGSFARQQALFPQPRAGTFRAWVSEEPEVLFERREGGHATGRWRGSYQAFVREVRAVCTLIEVKNENLTGVASSPDAPSGAAPRSDSYTKLPPIKVRCSLRLSYGDPQPILSYGDTLELTGKIEPPAPALNPGQFDYARYLKTKGVAYVMYVGAGKWRRAEGGAPQGWPLLRWSYALKRWAEEAIYRNLPYPQSALMDGILLGVRSPLPDDLVESFFLTGTVHILAVSGLITAFIAGLLFTLMRALQVPRKGAAALTLAALLFFVMMTGAHPPVCRAGLFSAMALLAVILERRVRGGVLLLATAFLLAALDPLAVEDLSFQISFLATAGLMVMGPWMMERLSFLWRPAAMLVTATTAAQLAVWCLVVTDFNQLSLYSVAANLVIVPLALFSTAGGLVLLAGSALHPALGTLFGAACEAPLRLLILLAGALSRLPKAGWIVASPPLPWVAAFHALLLAGFYLHWPSPRPGRPSEEWGRREGLLRRGRKAVAWAGLLFLSGSLLYYLLSQSRPQPLRVTFLSVGHGNAVVLRSPEGRVFVVDGGKESRGPDRYQTLVAYLRHLGVQEVEGVLDTHPDEDHVGGLVNLLSAYPVRSAFEGCGARADTEIYARFRQAVLEKGLSLEPLASGEELAALRPAGLSIEHPPKDYAPRLKADNNRSVVSLVSYGPFHLLLPGDLEKDGLHELLKDHRPFPPVTWLMAPHHGRRSGEPALCAEGFRPRFVVLSDFRDYPDDHEFFQEAVPGAVVLSTAAEGAVEVEVGPEGRGRYRTFRDPEWKNFR